MSIIPLNGTTGIIAGLALSAITQSIIFPRGFSADVTVEESHHDELMATENPVEQGASITDHAYNRPAELRVKIGYSDSSPLATQAAGLAVIAAGAAAANVIANVNAQSLSLSTGLSLAAAAVGTDYVEAIYQLFLLLKSSRTPFGLITQKRIYNNLLIRTIDTHTTEEWENSAILEIFMKEVILVQTQVVSVPPANQLAAPGVNAASVSAGTTQLSAAPAFNYANAPFSGAFNGLVTG